MTLSGLLAILIVHYIGDFLLQTSWMAKGKSKSDIPLLAHVAVYTSILFAFGWAFAGLSFALMWALSNGVFHFLVDWCTSRVMSRLWNNLQVRAFFAVLGLDQLLHYAFLFTTAVIILVY